MRQHSFAIGEYYHIYNRGVDKRDILQDNDDLRRFVESCAVFNTADPIGSIYRLSFKKPLSSPTTKLVSIICYCVNPNHFHLLLTPLVEKGIEKFMQRIGGYTRYFNEKYNRSGVLFQGKFKSKHITGNKYLLHVSSYINFNNRDLLGSPTTKLSCSSLEQYHPEKAVLQPSVACDTGIVLDQFQNEDEYITFATAAWRLTQELKVQSKKEFDFLPEISAYSPLSSRTTK